MTSSGPLNVATSSRPPGGSVYDRIHSSLAVSDATPTDMPFSPTLTSQAAADTARHTHQNRERSMVIMLRGVRS